MFCNNNDNNNTRFESMAHSYFPMSIFWSDKRFDYFGFLNNNASTGITHTHTYGPLEGRIGSQSYNLLVWPVPLAQVLPSPQLIFPSKTWFFGIYLNFHRQKSLQNQDLTHSESKTYHINSIESCPSRSFQQHQRHIPIPPKFSAMI